MIESILSRCHEFDLGLCRQRNSAIYFLLLDDEITYVGQTTNIDQRIYLHVNTENRWGVPKVFNRATWMAVPIEQLDAYEGALIRALRPSCNRRAPAYRGGDNEILIALGMEPHIDEAAAAKSWGDLVYAPRVARAS